MKSVESKGVEELRQLSPDPVSVQLKNKAKVTTEMLIDNMQEQPNGTVPCNQETLKQQQAKVLEFWNEIVQTSWGGSQVESSSSNQFWADEVEEEVASQGKKKLIWNEFDIAKLTNAGYKLEYVPPSKKGEKQVVECHASSLHPGRDWHSKTIAGPKRTLGLAYLTQRKTIFILIMINNT
ncbi:hypothetical protein KY290_027948 [Solanum tuberosum]|uniref:Uncharacterized protein n=1 Tax=Solanum tuberosum TaxID=4113 RepID=A0ABQ7UIC0_SOLTU|nr:hypothetical protein KY290_027948 [Solanum tuberosum]